MSKKVKEKKGPGEEVYENPDVLAERLAKTEDFIKTNRTLVFAIGGIIALVVAGVILYKYYVTSQNEIAQSEMFQAAYYFESDSLDKALNGDGNNYGFLDIIEEYSLTDAANLAHYYAGVIYLKQGQYDQSIEHLEDFSSSDLLLQGKAYSLIGDAYMELGNFSDAANFYNKAASYNANEFFTPNYLLKAALAYEKLGDTAAAIDSYDKIINDYVSATEYQQARKHKARLETLSK